ncbi:MULTISPECIES: glycosyltransferase WbuB [Methylococcus]|uniref:Glycosyltransferase WbuB n=1 Tax=Methylococcus capsulatus TaxID=414 RepID=A0ABZ2F3X5_METCP|nr:MULTISPECIES: glycosyltransferase WbuB [Methylococcus]MDF9393273.1 colanic acid biosynthesis glycosyltransferase WcaI [Methylococcus capsulatus]
MRILIYSINFAPELTGPGKYTGELAEWLAAHGHQVHVVTAPPYYPEWRVHDGYSGGWYRHTFITVAPSQPASSEPENRAGRKCSFPQGSIRVWRCPLWVPKQPSGPKRLLHLASFAVSSFPVMLRQVWWRPAVVWAVEPPLFCAPTAWLTGRLCGGKSWLHVQDFEVDAAFDLGLLRSGFWRRVVSKIECWLMRRFDRVSTISDKMIQRLSDKGIAEGVLFPNWVDTDRIVPLSVSSPFRCELGIADTDVVALYSGNMGRKQGLELLGDAARLLEGEALGQGEVFGKGALSGETEVRRLLFVFCGNGPGRSELEAECAGLSNVRFLDLQPVERLNDLLNLADIHLLPQRADVADLVMPSKLTGMLASGRPVVATAKPGTQLARVVEGKGIIVDPGDAVALSRAVATLASDLDLRRRLGEAARSYALAHLGKEALLTAFENSLSELAGQ